MVPITSVCIVIMQILRTAREQDLAVKDLSIALSPQFHYIPTHSHLPSWAKDILKGQGHVRYSFIWSLFYSVIWKLESKTLTENIFLSRRSYGLQYMKLSPYCITPFKNYKNFNFQWIIFIQNKKNKRAQGILISKI